MQNQRVLILDTNRKPLMPCHPARARKLLKGGKASVFRKYPFTIIIHDNESSNVQNTELKFDPGSKMTGCSLVISGEKGERCIFALEIGHRSKRIKKDLEKRKAFRHSRRQRKTRYRKSRFKNRSRPKGWLSPSLQSRVEHLNTWANKFIKFAPIKSIAVETVRFNTQKMQNPEISGKEYQQGKLAGYEVREYLLEKWGRKCVYCGKENIPLEVEHIIPKSRGGSNRVSNLTLSCKKCNQEKGSKTAYEFGFPNIQKQAGKSMRDVAAVNSTRYAIGDRLKSLGLPINFWSGGQTKYNRVKQGYSKEHWIDAACVGDAGESVFIPEIKSLKTKAMGHGSRVFCRPDRHGFPRQSPKQRSKTFRGFRSGDIVRAIVTRGKNIGKYIGLISIRNSGNFSVKMQNKTISNVSWRHCFILQRFNGYAFYQ